MTKMLLTGFIGFGLLAAPGALAQDRQTMQQSMQWEQYKIAAAARQAQHPARTEAQSSAVREDMSQSGADRAEAAAPKFRTEPTAAELRQAVAWEHFKDSAAARQAMAEHTENSK